MNTEKTALGIDIGGTKIYAGLVNKNGEILTPPAKYATPHSVDEIKKTLSDVIKNHGKTASIVAIATAGAVNNDNTKILSSTANLPNGYSDIDFQSLSENLPVFVENDANCAAWAEHTVGAAKGAGHSITLTLGTGVGGGIIINNKLLKGKSGAAGEMHFKMSIERKRPCTCGTFDCFEAYTSGRGLALTYKDILNRDLTTYQIIENAKNNDSGCILALDIWQRHLADGLIGLNDIFDTEIIVLSGSMAEFVDVEYVQNLVNREIVTTPVVIKHASAGNFAGLIGASLLALDKIS
jgi:glucokinase